MSLVRQWALFLLLSATCSWSQATFDFQWIEFEEQEFVRMVPEACVPTSFLYMLKFGPPEMREVYRSLPGEDDAEKLDRLMEWAQDERQNGEAVFFNPRKGGVNSASFQAFWDSLVSTQGATTAVYQHQLTHRASHETLPGAFVERIHQLILQSIERQVPVMLGVELSTTDHEKQEFVYALTHTVVVLGVQKELSESEAGFVIWYLDPAHGEIFSGHVYEELYQPFDAQIFENPTDTTWTWSDGQRGVVHSGGRFVSSPYLRLSAPSIGTEKILDWHQSRNLFIKTLMAGPPQN